MERILRPLARTGSVAPPETAAKSGKERNETDANLRAERSSADAGFAKNRLALETDEDQVLEVARARAQETLRMARLRSDAEMSARQAPATLRQEVNVARAVEDGAVAEEQARAAARLASEREDRTRALEALVLEREATDDGLVVERARADDAVAVRDEFLAMVSHDLRNMLGNVALAAGLLGKHAATQGEAGLLTAKHASGIQRSTTRMNRLVGDLLDVVSLEAGSLHVTLRESDAIEVVADAVEAFHSSFLVKGIALRTESANAPLLANFDRERILQVLANLLINALKFTEPGGKVVVSICRTGTGVQFSVVDSGVGIPVGQEAVIFERFRQGSLHGRPGHGLGLYIAKSIVEAHGGSIHAHAAVGGGSAFVFTLPAPV
jgi:signal transduction histidine kinase